MKTDNRVCADCGSKNTKRTIESYTYPYGIEEEKVELTSIIPVHICNNCNFSWFDYEAEDIIDKDIKKHIKKNQDNSNEAIS